MQTHLSLKTIVLVSVLITTALQASDRTGEISLRFSKTPLEKVLRSIEQQSVYRFIYSDEAIAASLPVNIHMKETDIKTIMNVCLKNQPITYIVKEEFVVLRLSEKMLR